MQHWSRLRTQLLALLAMLSALAGPASRPAGAQDRGDEEGWQWAQTQGTVEAYETYLRRYPLGKFTRDAYRCAVVLAARDQAPDIEVINPPACGGVFGTTAARPAPVSPRGDGRVGAAAAGAAAGAAAASPQTTGGVGDLSGAEATAEGSAGGSMY